MLVLTRRKEETIMIGDDIEITVLGIRGEQVRLGISAPPQISVHRKEVYDTLAQANRDAQAAAGPLKSFLRMISRKKPAPGRGHGARRSAGGAARPRAPGGARAPREDGNGGTPGSGGNGGAGNGSTQRRPSTS